MAATVITAIFGLLISGCLLTVAVLQWQLARTKLRFDLYNRRFEVLSSTMAFYRHIADWKKQGEDGRSAQDAAHARFIQAKIEAHYLFRPESGVVAALERIHEGVFKHVVSVKEAAPEDRFYGDIYPRIEAMNTFVLSTMEGEMAGLRAAIAPYISFQEIGHERRFKLFGK